MPFRYAHRSQTRAEGLSERLDRLRVYPHTVSWCLSGLRGAQRAFERSALAGDLLELRFAEVFLTDQTLTVDGASSLISGT